MNADALRHTVTALMPGLRVDLERLVRLPSVAFEGFPEEPVRQAAAAVADLLQKAGLPEVDCSRSPNDPQASTRRGRRRPARPPSCSTRTTTCSRRATTRPGQALPSSRRERAGRLYGRGAADDKSGIIMHGGALQTLGTDCRVGVKVLIEGQEENGQGGIEEFVGRRRAAEGRRHRDRGRRQLQPRRAHADHVPARHGRPRRRGRDPGGRRAQRHVRRPGARRADRPLAHDRHAARRRRHGGRGGARRHRVRRRPLRRGRLPRRRRRAARRGPHRRRQRRRPPLRAPVHQRHRHRRADGRRRRQRARAQGAGPRERAPGAGSGPGRGAGASSPGISRPPPRGASRSRSRRAAAARASSPGPTAQPTRPRPTAMAAAFGRTSCTTARAAPSRWWRPSSRRCPPRR